MWHFSEQRMCGVKLKDRLPSKERRERLGVDDIALVLQQNKLRWYGHVLRKDDQSINQSRFFFSGLSNLNHCEVHYSARWKDCCSRNVFK